MIDLSQNAFEQYVPAFRDSEARTYEAILPYMEQFRDTAYHSMKVPHDFPDTAKVEAYIYRNAAHRALPHLDLVLTDNGFAVVSNSNLAPASRDRVAALQERLREEKDDARDLLLFALCETEAWRTSDECRRLRSTLLWCPMICRRYGVTAPEGRPVYLREFLALLPQIEAAHYEVARIVSVEQAHWLLQHQDEYDRTDTTGDARIILREHCRRLMSALITGRRDSVRALTTRLQEFLNLRADELPEYNGSTKFQADHFTPYENGKNDPCFFFG